MNRKPLIFYRFKPGPAHFMSAFVGRMVVTPMNAVLRLIRGLTVSAGSFTLTGQPVLLMCARKLAAAVSSYVLTGKTVLLSLARALQAQRGSYSLSGQTARLSLGRTLQAVVGSILITGNSILLGLVRALGAQSGSYSITGQSVRLSVGSTLHAALASFLVTGKAVVLSVALQLKGVAGSYSITGESVLLNLKSTMQAQVASYSVTGQAVSLSYAAMGQFRAAGSFAYAGSGNSVSPGLPSGTAVNDILLCYAYSSTSAALTCTATTGVWVNIYQSGKYSVWWSRAVSGSTGPTVGNASGTTTAIIIGYYNCVYAGTPIDALGASFNQQTSSGDALSTTGITTNANGDRVVFAACSVASAATTWSSWAIANLTATSEFAASHGASPYYGWAGADAPMATAGATGTASVTTTSSYSNYEGFIVALLSALNSSWYDAMTASTNWTQYNQTGSVNFTFSSSGATLSTTSETAIRTVLYYAQAAATQHQRAQFTYQSITTGTVNIAIGYMLAVVRGNGSTTYYHGGFYYEWNNGSPIITALISRVSVGAETVLTSGSISLPSAGDIFELECTADVSGTRTLNLYHNGTQVLTTTDNTSGMANTGIGAKGLLQSYNGNAVSLVMNNFGAATGT